MRTLASKCSVCDESVPEGVAGENAAWRWALGHARAHHRDSLLLEDMEELEARRQRFCPAYDGGPEQDPAEEV